jgi:MFS family permease
MTSALARHTGRLLAVLLAGPFMAQADATIANVATPSIHADLGASGAALELVIGGYLIAFAVLLITGARLGETHGYRRVFLFGVGTFSLASLLCGLAPDPAILIAARVLQGAGAALMFPQTLTGIQLNFDGRERARAIGLYAVALSTGAVVGQILGGALISADLAGSHWRAIFLINVPIGAGVLGAALRYLPTDERRTASQLDLAGIATLSLAMILLVVPLAIGRSEGWPAWAWICLAASVPALLLFLAVERRVGANGGSALVNVGVLARSSRYQRREHDNAADRRLARRGRARHALPGRGRQCGQRSGHPRLRRHNRCMRRNRRARRCQRSPRDERTRARRYAAR